MVIDLKVEEFKPEFAGKMNFYLSAVDDRLRHADDRSSIGIILCKARDKVTAEYALRDTQQADRRLGIPLDRGVASGIAIQPAFHRAVGERIEERFS